MKDYLYVFATVILTVYGQIILKWRLGALGTAPAATFEKIKFLLWTLLDPFIFSGFLSAFLASICWMMAMTKLELTKAYPLTSLSPALVFLLGVLLLNETFTWGKVAGLLIIIIGIIVTVKC